MTAAYVRGRYRVDYKRGERIVVDGRIGTLVSFPSMHLGVRFDGQKHTARCHPTWRVRRPGRPEPTTCVTCGAVVVDGQVCNGVSAQASA